MTREEKLKKMCSDFSSLNGEQQDYILGILQALVFARGTTLQDARGASLHDAREASLQNAKSTNNEAAGSMAVNSPFVSENNS